MSTVEFASLIDDDISKIQYIPLRFQVLHSVITYSTCVLLWYDSYRLLFLRLTIVFWIDRNEEIVLEKISHLNLKLKRDGNANVEDE